jgi:putative NIF3 family GTP cyclohydrolase 1 type 2
MYRGRDVAKVFEAIAPFASGVPGDELGFVFGDPECEVTGVACLWNVQAQSIRAAVEQKLNLLICHEGLWLPTQTSPWYEGPAEAEIFSNRLRRELLERYGLTVYRSHSNWDALPQDGVPDQAFAALGFKGAQEVARRKFFSVQQLPAEMSLAELAEKTGRGLGFGACRIFGEREQRVRRIAFLIGGFGENQWHMPQAARDLGAEAIIIGEMSEFVVIACLEMGLPVIETTHSVSEIPGIKRQAEMLALRLPGLPVRYVPSGAVAFGHARNGG